MQPFRKITGLVAPLPASNVDTDQIVPKQFLKRVERTGFGEFLFYDWRYHSDGRPRKDFVLNQARFAGARILVAGRNFGCGSSREHAVWALTDYGFRVILAPSFADIFAGNCLRNGLLAATLPESATQTILQQAQSLSGYSVTVDLQQQSVSRGASVLAHFEINSTDKECLWHGLDEIGLTLQIESSIAVFESRREAGPKKAKG